MAEYHESFWVVAGTAAPIFILAEAVAFARSLIEVAAAPLAIPPRRPRPTPERFRETFRRGFVGSLRAFLNRTLVTYTFAGLSMFGNGTAFVLAVVSLAKGHDVYPVVSSADFLLIGFFALLLQFVIAAAFEVADERKRVSSEPAAP